jgi:hypothetical protein
MPGRIHIRAKGRIRPRHAPGTMNKVEQAYAAILAVRKSIGELHEYRFEAVKLRLADMTYYTCDFWLLLPDGEIELVEVKAVTKAGKLLIEDDAAVKFKVARETFPEFRFRMFGLLPKSVGGGWREFYGEE